MTRDAACLTGLGLAGTGLRSGGELCRTLAGLSGGRRCSWIGVWGWDWDWGWVLVFLGGEGILGYGDCSEGAPTIAPPGPEPTMSLGDTG